MTGTGSFVMAVVLAASGAFPQQTLFYGPFDDPTGCELVTLSLDLRAEDYTAVTGRPSGSVTEISRRCERSPSPAAIINRFPAGKLALECEEENLALYQEVFRRYRQQHPVAVPAR
jgi:hypothetical protein